MKKCPFVKINLKSNNFLKVNFLLTDSTAVWAVVFKQASVCMCLCYSCEFVIPFLEINICCLRYKVSYSEQTYFCHLKLGKSNYTSVHNYHYCSPFKYKNCLCFGDFQCILIESSFQNQIIEFLCAKSKKLTLFVTH